VGDDGQLDGLDGLQVEHAALVGAHQVGDGDHGHLVDRFEPAEPGALGHVAGVVLGDDPIGDGRDGRGCGQRDGALGRLRRGARADDLGEGDDLGPLGDGAHDVVLAALDGHVGVLLDLLAVDLDGHGEPVGGFAFGGVADLDADVVGLGGFDGDGAQPADEGLGTRDRFGPIGSGGADADDIAVAAAVEEVAVDGVRQVAAFDELAEHPCVLAPVGDQGGVVHRSSGRESDECGDSGADAFDWPGAAVGLFNIDTR
jgi:hypothetical protein